MQDTYKQLTINQFHAALCTLNLCIDRCPESHWDAPVVNLKFCQVVFHTLFFADYYLQPSDDAQAIREQPFHRDHASYFRDYEELRDVRQQLLYDKYQ